MNSMNIVDTQLGSRDPEAASEASAALAATGARRPYSPPQVVSSEDLELAAATCDPPVGGLGKNPLNPSCASGSGS